MCVGDHDENVNEDEDEDGDEEREREIYSVDLMYSGDVILVNF